MLSAAEFQLFFLIFAQFLFVVDLNQHLDQLVELKGEYAAVREMRKHIAWYTKGRKNGASIRKAVNQIESARQMKEAIRFEE